MLREVPSSLLERWMAFYRQEPFGDDWQQAATVAAAAMNPHMKKAIPVKDFIPNYRSNAAMTDDEIASSMEAMMSAFGVTGGSA